MPSDYLSDNVWSCFYLLTTFAAFESHKHLISTRMSQFKTEINHTISNMISFYRSQSQL